MGMQAWIVGRQAVTWQCSVCFLENLTLAYEATGRGKCKVMEIVLQVLQVCLLVCRSAVGCLVSQ